MLPLKIVFIVSDVQCIAQATRPITIMAIVGDVECFDHLHPFVVRIVTGDEQCGSRGFFRFEFLKRLTKPFCNVRTVASAATVRTTSD